MPTGRAKCAPDDRLRIVQRKSGEGPLLLRPYPLTPTLSHRSRIYPTSTNFKCATGVNPGCVERRSLPMRFQFDLIFSRSSAPYAERLNPLRCHVVGKCFKG